MAGMTQKELKKPYFHCGPIWKGKKIVISRSKTLKEIKAQNDMILKYLLFTIYYLLFYSLQTFWLTWKFYHHIFFLGLQEQNALMENEVL